MTINKSVYKRNYGLDILKIVMMLWIILFHMANHSQADLYTMPVSANWLFEALFKIGGYRRLLFCANYWISIP